MFYNENIRQIVLSLPEEPGIYQYFDRNGTIIYVGKAKNLKRRVSSYFNKVHDNRKTEALVKNIFDLQTIVVRTEQDALILENNLIKKYQPKYNILLKDDKTYPWICIKNEPFPRIFQTRRVDHDGSLYFGPFTSGFIIKTLIDLFHQAYKFRTCALKLSDENVSRGKFRVCLKYHIGNCLGACEGLQTANSYMNGVEQIKKILRGNITSVISELKNSMKELSDELKFEEAQEVKIQLDALLKYQAKSTVVSPSIRNLDVYSFERDGSTCYVNFLKVIRGAVMQSFTLEIKEKVEENDEDMLLAGITEIRQRISSDAVELIVPFLPSFEFDGIKYTVPQRGDRKRLLELSEKNVKFYILEQKKKDANSKSETPSERILKTAQKDLRLHDLPFHIECFDNSNLQGTNPVASCVVFKNAKPSKKDYRHFNIKTVVGANDFASMEEIIYRRYKRLLDEGQKLPNLVIVDGGKGQLSSALNALDQLGIRGKLPIIGIAKRLEEIYYPDDPIPLYIDKNSESLKLIQRLRDEAHRFGITHHRDQRSKSMLVSELDGIKGVGPKTQELLLVNLKSVDGVKAASYEQLKNLLGESKAKIVFDYFKAKD